MYIACVTLEQEHPRKSMIRCQRHTPGLLQRSPYTDCTQNECTTAVTTFATLGGPIVFWNAPGPGGASLCCFPNGNPLPGVQADHTRSTASDLDNFAADDMAGDTGNTDVPWLVE